MICLINIDNKKKPCVQSKDNLKQRWCYSNVVNHFYKMKKYPLLLLIIFCSLITSCQDRASVQERLQTLLDSTLESNPKAVGIILHVKAPDQEFSWSGAAGYSNKDTKEPLQEDQPGQIGSITKTFVAATILRLIEKERLKLDQPIGEVMPERTRLLLEENGYQPDSITIGHLLSHKGGIASIETDKFIEKEKTDQKYRWTRDEQIRDAITINKKGEIGYAWSYSDVNYLLLTEIIEEITGTSFYLAMRDLLKYEELGLNNTWFYTLERDPAYTKKQVYQYKETRNWTSSYDDSPTWSLYGSAGIVSTAKDLANFSEALFGGKLYEMDKTLNLMLSDIATKDGKEVEEVHQDTIQYNYYMGLEEIKTTGIHVIGHAGYWGTWMVYFPEENIHIGLFILNADVMQQFDLKLLRQVLDEIEQN